MILLVIVAFIIIIAIIGWLFSISPILGILAIFSTIIFTIISEISDRDKKIAEDNRRTNSLQNIENDLYDFFTSQKYVSSDKDNALLFDEKNSKICIINSNLGEKAIFNYKDILESEIIENDISITKTSRSSQVGGALLGSFLAGGVGAVIGGLSGKQTTEQEVNKITLKIVVNDTKKPFYLINFLNDYLGVKKTSSKYEEAVNKANHWHSLISILIRQADDSDKIHKDNTNSYLTISDEIKKLSDLYKEGVLTEEEFKVQKEKILNH